MARNLYDAILIPKGLMRKCLFSSLTKYFQFSLRREIAIFSHRKNLTQKWNHQAQEGNF